MLSAPLPAERDPGRSTLPCDQQRAVQGALEDLQVLDQAGETLNGVGSVVRQQVRELLRGIGEGDEGASPGVLKTQVFSTTSSLSPFLASTLAAARPLCPAPITIAS